MDDKKMALLMARGVHCGYCGLPVRDCKCEPEGTFSNGDIWNGHKYLEDDTWYFRAIDKNGREYDTDEVPATDPIMTIVQYMGECTPDFVREDMEERRTNKEPA
jgi:hypothetical protein